MNLYNPADFFEVSQRFEYIDLSYIFDVLLDKIDSIECAVTFLSFHLKNYLKDGYYFFDLKDYDPICDFLAPSTMPPHNVSIALKAILTARTIPKDELEKIGVHRMSLEKYIGFSLLKPEYLATLEHKESPPPKKAKDNPDRKNEKLLKAFKVFIAVHYGEDVANKIRSNIAECDPAQGIKYQNGAIQVEFDKKGYKVPYSGKQLDSLFKDIDISDLKIT